MYLKVISLSSIKMHLTLRRLFYPCEHFPSVDLQFGLLRSAMLYESSRKILKLAKEPILPYPATDCILHKKTYPFNSEQVGQVHVYYPQKLISRILHSLFFGRRQCSTTFIGGCIQERLRNRSIVMCIWTKDGIPTYITIIKGFPSRFQGFGTG